MLEPSEAGRTSTSVHVLLCGHKASAWRCAQSSFGRAVRAEGLGKLREPFPVALQRCLLLLSLAHFELRSSGLCLGGR